MESRAKKDGCPEAEVSKEVKWWCCNRVASYSRYSIDTLMYKWHRYLRGSDYTYLLDNCLASSVYLRNLECGLSSRGEAAD